MSGQCDQEPRLERLRYISKLRTSTLPSALHGCSRAFSCWVIQLHYDDWTSSALDHPQQWPCHRQSIQTWPNPCPRSSTLPRLRSEPLDKLASRPSWPSTPRPTLAREQKQLCPASITNHHSTSRFQHKQTIPGLCRVGIAV